MFDLFEWPPTGQTPPWIDNLSDPGYLDLTICLQRGSENTSLWDIAISGVSPDSPIDVAEKWWSVQRGAEQLAPLFIRNRDYQLVICGDQPDWEAIEEDEDWVFGHECLRDMVHGTSLHIWFKDPKRVFDTNTTLSFK